MTGASKGGLNARTKLGALWLTSCLVLLVGCAGSSTELLYSASMDELPRPPVLVVDTFGFQADVVTVDESGPGFASEGASRSDRLALGKSVAEALATKLVEQCNKVGIEARRLTRGVSPPTGALVLKGQFVEIDEGDQMARVTVGFGAGTEELRVRGQLYQVEADGGLRRIREGLAEAHGDKMPGMAVPVAAGAAGGHVVASAAVSAGLNTVSELRTGMDSAAQNLAEQLAERAAAIYKDQGWLK